MMARALSDQIRRDEPSASVWLANDFGVLGPRLGQLLGDGYRLHLERVTWSYDLAYRLFGRVPVAQRAGELALYGLGGPALAQVIACHDPDVVVGVHPVINAVLGRLRAAGRLHCPVAAVVEPLGGLAFWVQPGADMHLLNYEQALRDVRARAGPDSVLVAVRPLVREEFHSPLPRARARAELGIDDERPLVAISGGGWGAGDLHGATDACLALPGAHVIAVTGRNGALRAAIEARHRTNPRVIALGFTDRMRTLLSAADAFVTATAGLSCLEARLCGCPTVCYPFEIGHIQDHVAQLQRHGLARAATSPGQLTRELLAALATGRDGVVAPRADLPDAGEALRALANQSPGPRAAFAAEPIGRSTATRPDRHPEPGGVVCLGHLRRRLGRGSPGGRNEMPSPESA